MLSLTLLFVLVFHQSFLALINSLGEDRAGQYASRAVVCLSAMRYLGDNCIQMFNCGGIQGAVEKFVHNLYSLQTI